jgi:hypothetical protein
VVEVMTMEEMNDLEKAQIILQMFMERYNLTEEEAKKKINDATIFPLGMTSAIDMMFPPAFKKTD